MKLYEARNGYIGESYTRCYVWAENINQALDLARIAFMAQATQIPKYHTKPLYDESYYSDIEIIELFDSTAIPFATQPSSEGWSSELVHQL